MYYFSYGNRSHKYFSLNTENGFCLQSSLVAAGIGLAAVGFAGRYILRHAPGMSQKLSEAMKAFPAESLATSKYYKGGFDPKMNKREAALILGISPTSSKGKVIATVASKTVSNSTILQVKI